MDKEKDNAKKVSVLIHSIDPNNKVFKRTLRVINKKIDKKDMDKIKTK